MSKGYQTWTIQIIWQHRVHKMKKNKKQHNMFSISLYDKNKHKQRKEGMIRPTNKCRACHHYYVDIVMNIRTRNPQRTTGQHKHLIQYATWTPSQYWEWTQILANGCEFLLQIWYHQYKYPLLSLFWYFFNRQWTNLQLVQTSLPKLNR